MDARVLNSEIALDENCNLQLTCFLNKQKYPIICWF